MALWLKGGKAGLGRLDEEALTADAGVTVRGMLVTTFCLRGFEAGGCIFDAITG
jgi:hypothetical protein